MKQILSNRYVSRMIECSLLFIDCKQKSKIINLPAWINEGFNVLQRACVVGLTSCLRLASYIAQAADAAEISTLVKQL